jgi:Secreted protein containing C-terminal beta-propeller domain distantly related to WD-40 repeats
MSRLKVLGIALALAVAAVLALGGLQGLGAPAHQQTGARSSGGSAQRAMGLVVVNLTEAASALAGVQPAAAVAAAGQATPIPTPIQGPATTAAVESPPAQTASAQYSSTNVQVEGIDEGDFVKTDGRWIYLCYGGVLYLITPGLKIEGWYAVGGGQCQLLAAEGRVLAIWSNGAATGLVLLSADGGLRPVARFQIEGRPLGARLEGSYAYVVVSSPLTPLYLVNGTALGELPGVSPTPAGVVAVVAVDMSSGRFNYTALAAGDIYRVFMYGDRLYLFQRPDGLQMLADIVEAGRSRLPEGLWEELRGYIENGDYLGLYNALSRSRAASALIGLSAPVNTTVYEIAVDGLSLGVAAVGECPAS